VTKTALRSTIIALKPPAGRFAAGQPEVRAIIVSRTSAAAIIGAGGVIGSVLSEVHEHV
jgi:hypothetical protein